MIIQLFFRIPVNEVFERKCAFLPSPGSVWLVRCRIMQLHLQKFECSLLLNPPFLESHSGLFLTFVYIAYFHFLNCIQSIWGHNNLQPKPDWSWNLCHNFIQSHFSTEHFSKWAPHFFFPPCPQNFSPQLKESFHFLLQKEVLPIITVLIL